MRSVGCEGIQIKSRQKALLVWLFAVPLSIPLRGKAIRWVVGTLVVIVDLAEIAARSWTYENE